MPTEKETQQAEELSLEIDNLIIKRNRPVRDLEVAGLLEVADIVRHSCTGDEIPHSLIAGMADTLAAELKTQRDRRWRRSLYTALAGSAAAVLLAVGVHVAFFQQGNDIPYAQNSEKTVVQPPAVVAETPGENDRKDLSVSDGRQTKENVTDSSPAASDKKQVSGLLPDVITEQVNGAAKEENKDEKSQQLAMRQTDIATEPNPEGMLMAKARMSVASSRQGSGDEKKITRLLVLPNQTAQSVFYKQDSQVIEQIYVMDGREKIRIIQRFHREPQEHDTTGSTNRKQEGLAASDKLNHITVTLGEYDVTLEGKQATEELKKLANSLVLREVAP